MAMILDAGRFDRAQRSLMRTATYRAGKYVESRIRIQIKKAPYTPNASLTTAIKGSTKPLVDHADIWKAITTSRVDPNTVFVGVLNTALGPDGKRLVNITAVIHDGFAIPVTKKMRGLFHVLWLATTGKMDPAQLTGRAAEIYSRLNGRAVIQRLKPSTTTIVIPKRPFIRDVFEDQAVRAAVMKYWEDAYDRAVRARP